MTKPEPKDYHAAKRLAAMAATRGRTLPVYSEIQNVTDRAAFGRGWVAGIRLLGVNEHE